MRRRLFSCVLTATALLATACSSGGSSGVAVVQRDYGSGPKLLVLQPGQVRHDLNVDFQFGAFQVTIGTAVYDPAQQQFVAGVRFRNTAGEWNFVSLASTLRHGTDAWPLLGDTADVPPGAATDMTVSVGSLSADPFTDGSTWVWGDDDEAQAVINLADGTVTGGVTAGTGRSRNTATPITPTLAGRPVRAAYDSASAVNSKAATSWSLLRQPVIWYGTCGPST